MLKSLVAVAAALLALAMPVAAQPAPAPVEVMVLGTYHMANPGRDVVNIEADDVTHPRRQAEIAAVTDALAAWRPTKILVESQRPAPFTVDEYRSFDSGDLGSERSESVQIGFRLARRLGHRDVFGFDEQPGDGEPEYFQFGRLRNWATRHGRVSVIDEALAFIQDFVAQDGRVQQDQSIAEILLRHNDPERDRIGHARAYYAMLPLGDADDQVGAEFNSYWYMRNAKMFAKVGLVAEPGDRVLVIVGSGHRYWLTHFAELTPGFRLVDSRPWLQRAAAASRNR